MSQVYKKAIGLGSSLSTFTNNQPPLSIMTHHLSTFNNKYWGPGYTISRDIQGSYSKAHNTVVVGSYPSPSTIYDRVDEGNRWYLHTFADCHLGDFLWGTAMQMEWKQITRHRQDGYDNVLAALIDCGIQDKAFPDVPDVGVDRAMRHSSSMAQRLLVHIENLKTQVILWMIRTVVTILTS